MDTYDNYFFVIYDDEGLVEKIERVSTQERMFEMVQFWKESNVCFVVYAGKCVLNFS